MKTLTISALALTLASGTAIAQVTATDNSVVRTEEPAVQTDQTSARSAGAAMAEDGLIRTRDITGGDIYSMNGTYDEASWTNDRFNEQQEGWNDIGEIEDIVLSSDGQMIGIVAEIGGFLDIGDKHVLIPVNDVKLVPVDNREYAYVTRLSEEQLETMEEVDEGFWD